MNNPIPENLFLIGPMGAGKTSVGILLAKTLELAFTDSDREIEARTGVSIPTIFDIEGEAGFRRREAEVIDELTQKSGIVLATGGGVVLNDENRRHLKDRGCVVYLKASIEQLYERTRHDRNRPLLQTDDPLQRIREIFNERDPIYRDLADLTINTDKRSIQHVVKEILEKLTNHSE